MHADTNIHIENVMKCNFNSYAKKKYCPKTLKEGSKCWPEVLGQLPRHMINIQSCFGPVSIPFSAFSHLN